MDQEVNENQVIEIDQNKDYKNDDRITITKEENDNSESEEGFWEFYSDSDEGFW